MSDLRVTNLKGRTPGSSPTLPDGVVVTGVATATNVSATNVSVSSSITAASFHGDGSQLNGIAVNTSFLVSGRVSNTTILLSSGSFTVEGRSGNIDINA